MNSALAHRGPDEGGVLDTGFGAVGMRRLSIVDIAQGRQPMSTADGRFTLVYNGELYDFDRLRDRLTAHGCSFRTRSDTEVLLQALVADGPACLDYLNGMFAFALVDHHQQSVFLARDHLGIKPLYYYLSPRGELVFSSELKSLLTHRVVPRRLDHESLTMLLVDRYVADPWTLFAQIRQLPPGHCLRWHEGRLEVQRYYRLQPAPTTLVQPADYLAELQTILSNAVRSQLVADVPVGVLLSGGIDSSTVAAYACQNAGGRIKSFSVGFSRPDYDESGHARQVAQYLGTQHHEVFVPEAGFDARLLDLILDHVGQPLADISCIPTYLVARFARQHVKVVLSGDGGDELFGGYDYLFWAARIRRVAQHVPERMRRAGCTALAALAPLARGVLAAPARRARKGLELTLVPPPQQLRRLLALWSEENVRELLADGRSAPLRPLFERPVGNHRKLAAAESAMLALTQTKLPGAILTKVDRMSMAASLEVRPPLLDRRVVEFAMRLPLHLKMRGRIGKWLLREAGRQLLPRSVYAHRKQGFALPLFDWFDGSFWDMLSDLYRPGSPAAALFQRAPLDRTIAQGRSALKQPSRLSDYAASCRVWQLAMLGRWIDRFRVTL